jgi:hypothetical protein
MRLVERLFLAATKRLDYVERAQARASSNGKVRFGSVRPHAHPSGGTRPYAAVGPKG